MAVKCLTPAPLKLARRGCVKPSREGRTSLRLQGKPSRGNLTGSVLSDIDGGHIHIFRSDHSNVILYTSRVNSSIEIFFILFSAAIFNLYIKTCYFFKRGFFGAFT